MPWQWSQSTGILTGPAGTKIAQGYAGNGAGLNNPQMQDAHGVGPLPCGDYLIGDLVDKHVTTEGVTLTNALPLIPDPKNQMFNRAGFWVHGDTIAMDYSASDGCPVVPLWARMQMAQSDDRQFRVVA